MKFMQLLMQNLNGSKDNQKIQNAVIGLNR